MRPHVSVIAIVLLCATSAFGFPENLVVKVDKTVDAEALWRIGFMHLADLGSTYLVQGTRPALKRLADTDSDFTLIATVQPEETIFLVRPRRAGDELLYPGALINIGGGLYLAKLTPQDSEDARLLPFLRTRLVPGRFPEPQRTRLPHRPISVTPRPEVELILASVSGDSVWKRISELSGNEPAFINGTPYTLLTRYSLSPMNDQAAEYIREQFEDCGLDVEFSGCVMGKYDFNSGDFADSNYGWVVGTTQRVFKTWDGGQTWIRQRTTAMSSTFWDVCFLDSLEGWVAGTDGWVYHTEDGGSTWGRQGPSNRFAMYAVCFLDSLNGWIAGYSGRIAMTSDGGQTWTDVPSGTSESLYRFHFQSPNRGWLCGDTGTILFWDGVSWTAQTSGVSDFLLGVDFIDDNTGWVAGGYRTILKTTDGGANWIAQDVPILAASYLFDVCFHDGAEGWAVGYLGTILHTSDGGANWEMSGEVGSWNHLRWIELTDSSEAWAGGMGCALLHTADAGMSWQSRTRNLPSGAWKLLNNVVATKPGTTSDDQVIICGHYDSISDDPYNLAPGADDNASGTAAVLEAARLMAPYPYERTIKFICFSGEERGPYGSGAYVDSVKQAGDVIVGTINLDMIGYVDAVPESIDVIGNTASEWLTDLAVDCGNAYVPGLPSLKTIDDTRMTSDHASFWLAGYSALHLIEDSPPVYPHYHTTTDTLGNLTQSFATDVVKLAIATLAELAVPDTAAAGVGRVAVAAIDRIYPNPFSLGTTISLTPGMRIDLEVSIFNTEGRLVRRLVKSQAGPGRSELPWDGKNDMGIDVSPGVYLVRVRTARTEACAKVVLLR
jgi:photosystem II stability/assembly factor-like uncharacterized protein